MSQPTDPSRRDVLAGAALGAVALSSLPGCATVNWDPDAIPEDRSVFPRTVIAGDPGVDKVVIVVHVATGEPCTLRLWLEGRPRRVVDERPITPDEHGFAKLRLTGLEPGTRYQYCALTGPVEGFTGRSLVGHIQTLPAPGKAPPVTLALASCVGLNQLIPDYIGPDETEPHTYPLLEMAAALDWDLFIHVGDQAYMDRIWDAGGTEAQYLDAWGMVHGGSYRAVYPKAAMMATWDDHEVTDNGTVDPWTTDPSEVERIANGQRAWYRVMPIDGDDPEETPIWRSVRWGDTVEVVLLDCRYELQPEPEVRQLSDAQLDWLLGILRDSPCRFIAVCTDKPFADIMLTGGIEYPGRGERWQGHRADRQRVTDLLDAEQRERVLFLTGDIHMNYLGRLSETGDAISDRIHEVCTTSGNINPTVNALSEDQFDFKAQPPHLPLITFDADADTITVRFVDLGGQTAHEQVLTFG